MSESINKAMIEELKDLMGDDFGMLIETFISDSEQRIIDLNVAITANNATDLREIAHGLKGSSSNLGAEELASISYTLESMGLHAELDDAAGNYQKLIAEYSKVKDYFTSLL